MLLSKEAASLGIGVDSACGDDGSLDSIARARSERLDAAREIRKSAPPWYGALAREVKDNEPDATVRKAIVR